MSPGRQKALSAAPVDRQSDSVALLFALATAYHRHGNLAEARAGYKRVLKKHRNHFDALHMLAVCEHMSGNSDSAERLLRQALLVDRQSVAAGYSLGVNGCQEPRLFGGAGF